MVLRWPNPTVPQHPRIISHRGCHEKSEGFERGYEPCNPECRVYTTAGLLVA